MKHMVPITACFVALWACHHAVLVQNALVAAPGKPSPSAFASASANALADDPEQDIVNDDEAMPDIDDPVDSLADSTSPKSPAALQGSITCDAQFADIRNEQIAAMNAELASEFKSYQERCKECDDDECPSHGYGSSGGRIAGSNHEGAQFYSQTNCQVADVDEGDILKTDGRYIYLLAKDSFRILRAFPPEKTREIAVETLPGTPLEMFATKTRAVVFVATGYAYRQRCKYAYDCELDSDGTSTSVVVFDTHDRAHPKKVRQIDLSGTLIATRRIRHAIYAVTVDGYGPAPVWNSFYSDQCHDHQVTRAGRALFERLKTENLVAIEHQNWLSQGPKIVDNGKAIEVKDCANFYREPTHEHTQFTSVTSFDARDFDGNIGSQTLLAGGGTVYSSTKALYLASTRSRAMVPLWFGRNEPASVDEITRIHKFHLGKKPQNITYVASGEVAGHVLNQFSIDEENDLLRVAATRGYFPDRNEASSITVLQQNGPQLRAIGLIGGVSPREDLRSARFDGDRAYMATFEKTDPLFVFDLADPRNPKQIGELRVPGFSTYIHRLDHDHLLTIGFDARVGDHFADISGLLLEIFDVSDPKNPRIAHRFSMGSRGSSSRAALDHLAFNYFAPKSLLALPVSICDGGSDGAFGGKANFSGLAVFHVDPETGFQLLGGIDQSNDSVDCAHWWSQGDSVVKRSVFMDDYVYAISPTTLKIAAVGALGTPAVDWHFNATNPPSAP